MRLRSKILSWALPLTLVPFVLTALAVYYFVIRGQQIRAEEEVNRLLSEAIASLRKEQKAARDDIDLIAASPAVAGYLQSAIDPRRSSAHRQSKEAEARSFLQLFADRSRYYFQLSLVDAQGQERIKFSKLPGGQGAASIKGEDYFRRTLIVGSVQSPVARIGPDRFVSVLTSKVGQDKFLGAVVLQLNADAFQRSIRPLLASHGLNTFLFDDRGLVFAKSFAGAEEEACLSRLDLPKEAAALLAMPSLELSNREILSGTRTYVFTVLPAETYARAYYEPQSGENWFIGVLREKPGALPEAVTFQIIFGTILLTAIGAVLWATTRFARRIAAPLEQVSGATASVAQGNFEIDLSVRTGDEVEALAVAVKRMADDLKSYREELVRAAKLATIGEMASEISHEIQNRISGISLWTQYLDAELAASDPKREYLEEMKAGLGGFNSLLADLKQFYKTPILNLTDVDVNVLVRASLSTVDQRLNDRMIKVELALDHDLTSIVADAEKIKSVILNLLLNAIEAVDEEGRIEVRTSTLEAAPGDAGQAGVKLVVSDNGCGIAKQDLPRLFYPFYSTKGSGGGLGLAITSNIIAAHGGTIEVESKDGEGATFTVKLQPSIGRPPESDAGSLSSQV